ncbi:hypothetical protein KCP73_11500 [Salmonella enterica subsp. enterica]|nr:hypothetical protein KCP73_11500 [Salmonella enterica subsp. enterica]
MSRECAHSLLNDKGIYCDASLAPAKVRASARIILCRLPPYQNPSRRWTHPQALTPADLASLKSTRQYIMKQTSANKR